MSLVEGVQTTLKAVAPPAKSGGAIDSVNIGGSLRSRADNAVIFEVDECGSIQDNDSWLTARPPERRSISSCD